jgi:hypothetical protein
MSAPQRLGVGTVFAAPMYKEVTPTHWQKPRDLELLEKATYGFAPSKGEAPTRENMRKNFRDPKVRALMKADHPMLTTTTGVRNAVFGSKLWTQVSELGVPFHILPKGTWDESHYRAKTAASVATAPGVDPAATVMPDTEIMTPAEVQVQPRLGWHGIEKGVILDAVSRFQANEDILGWNEVMQSEMETFINRICVALMTTPDTLAAHNFESLYRINASHDEGVGQSWGANDNDLKSHLVNGANGDRESADSWLDGYVENAALAAAVPLSMAMFDNVIAGTKRFRMTSGNKVWLTGADTVARTIQLQRAAGRVEPKVGAEITFNGIKTLAGGEAVYQVSTVYGYPILDTDLALQDTLSKILYQDMDFVRFAFAQPITWEEMAPNVQTMYALDRPVGVAGAYTIGNVTCKKFQAQGKIIQLA